MRKGGIALVAAPSRGLLSTVLLATVAFSTLAGCSGEEFRGPRIDPDAFGSDQGTLISIADVRSVAQRMTASMLTSRRLARLREEGRPLRILLGPMKQRTSIAVFDKEIFLNRFVASLFEADGGVNYRFLARPGSETAKDAFPEETGADLVLSGELREILDRREAPGGGEIEKRTIQYSLALESVRDGSRVWGDSVEVVKMQVTGAVYR